MLEKIKDLAANYKQEFIDIRRHIHANPELSYVEFETSKFIQSKLMEWGIPFEIKANTGVVGLIKGKNPDERIIALRADMDALPIVEENDVPYKSKNIGVMHACGHDVHTTCLLGAAKILNEATDISVAKNNNSDNKTELNTNVPKANTVTPVKTETIATTNTEVTTSNSVTNTNIATAIKQREIKLAQQEPIIPIAGKPQ